MHRYYGRCSCGLVDKVSDAKHNGCEFKPLTGQAVFKTDVKPFVPFMWCVSH